MDCEEVQLSILESLAEPVGGDQRLAIKDHLGSCAVCVDFERTQRLLDARLIAAFPAAHLSPAFRTVLKKRTRRDPASIWPDFLPDVAHLGGCALAMMFAAIWLPRHSGTVMLVGASFTFVTYFLQAVIRTSLERIE